jgi:hypothetical protein
MQMRLAPLANVPHNDGADTPAAPPITAPRSASRATRKVTAATTIALSPTSPPWRPSSTHSRSCAPLPRASRDACSCAHRVSMPARRSDLSSPRPDRVPPGPRPRNRCVGSRPSRCGVVPSLGPPMQSPRYWRMRSMASAAGRRATPMYRPRASHTGCWGALRASSASSSSAA